ncbi:hypothetical protein HYDPIDRAFT_112413 [Hydnomerulius pinastri MD-312]|uniref:SAP domain-containing protein n=1 Tax=Hydnomerulius pinastri MD-312 TaxID=994086 RepID=A0A0C9W8P7_9AGAM|nr:hypothetical protein HYDPIDRAFT_112413 [Hydnomerulius pinastri MD-312]
MGGARLLSGDEIKALSSLPDATSSDSDMTSTSEVNDGRATPKISGSTISIIVALCVLILFGCGLGLFFALRRFSRSKMNNATMAGGDNHREPDNRDSFHCASSGADVASLNSDLGAAEAGIPSGELDFSKPMVFPGELKENGTIRIQYLTLAGQRNETLQTWCRDFHIPVSGNKSQLQQRLAAFSMGGEDLWEATLKPGARRRHKGPRALGSGIRKATSSASQGLKLTRMKLSNHRRDELLGNTAVESNAVSCAFAVSKVVERSKDLRTTEQINGLVPWANCFAEEKSYRPPVLGAPMSSMIPGTTLLALPHPPSCLSVQHLQMLDKLLVFLQSREDGTTACLPTPPSLRSENDCSTIESTSSPATVSNNTNTRTPADCRITFLDGTTMCIQSKDIPAPPFITFKDGIVGIVRLNATWDDSAQWDGTSPLHIYGRPIPITYWRELYRYRFPERWTVLKSNWSNWKVIVAHFRQGTLRDFERAFSDKNGTLWGISQITCHLRQLQRRDDEDIVRYVQEAYGPEVMDHLRYRKGSSQHDLTKNSAIAKRVRKMGMSVPPPE